MRFVTDPDQPVTAVMTPKERLVTVREGEAREVVLKKCTSAAWKKRWWWMIPSICSRHDHCKDFQKAERKPNACKDEHGRLRVGAAVGAGAGNEERVDALVAAGGRSVNRLFSRSFRRRVTAHP